MRLLQKEQSDLRACLFDQENSNNSADDKSRHALVRLYDCVDLPGLH